jgi:hypothetical protein
LKPTCQTAIPLQVATAMISYGLKESTWKLLEEHSNTTKQQTVGAKQKLMKKKMHLVWAYQYDDLPNCHALSKPTTWAPNHQLASGLSSADYRHQGMQVQVIYLKLVVHQAMADMLAKKLSRKIFSYWFIGERT